MAVLPTPTLIVFGGLPGTGKTTVSQALATRLRATYLRIDIIEQTLKSAALGPVGPTGYTVANALAEANLKLGNTVVADCVNPVAASRSGWRETATRSAARLVEIEVVCSDPVEHRARVERRSADIPGLVLPTWQDVLNRVFEPWHGDHLILDTAATSITDAIRHAEDYVMRPKANC